MQRMLKTIAVWLKGLMLIDLVFLLLGLVPYTLVPCSLDHHAPVGKCSMS